MLRLLRTGLVLAALAGAFAAGFLFKARPTTAEAAPQVVVAPPPAPVIPPAGPTPTTQLPDIRLPEPPAAPTTVLGPPAAAHPEIDPSDPAYQLIKRQLGIKTTIIDNPEPPPLVLTDGHKDPVPMGGPMPRLEPPPAPSIPTVDAPPIAPPTNPVHLINTRDVALDFEVTRVGVSKVTAVELWTTRDDGKTWAKTDRMTGSQSPFRTRLGSEGVYGFQLVFESES